MSYTAAIVLTAGEASRFGSPKQVLVWKRKTLVERTMQNAIDAGCKKIVVVTGAHEKVVTNALKNFTGSKVVSLAQNPHWEEGMHTSIACGMKTLLEASPTLDAVLVLTIDQPRIDAQFLRKLIAAQQGFDAAALGYPSGAGVPACFGESLFQRLLNLQTSGGGAKGILRDPLVKTNVLIDPERQLDIDTFTDWNDFKQADH